MVAILNERVKMQIRELEGIRSGTATKLWYEVAEKNFAKSLDRRSHYFKHSEKNINRPQTIVDSLDLIRYTQKPTILNTFEGLSKMEHINHYSEPKLDFQPGNTNNPFLVMYFENE
jgi:histone deacetylase complex regulatory component SIN3